MYRTERKKVCKFCQATARQGQAEKLSRARREYLATTYQPFFSTLYFLRSLDVVILGTTVHWQMNDIEPRPIQQIIPTGEEIWAFHVSVARDIIAETTP